MLKLAAFTTALLITAGVLAQSSDYVDELIVTGEKFDPDKMTLIDFDILTGMKLLAAKEFKHKNYEEAFPTLLKMAKLGFVDAQARVGFIYLHGLGGQPKSNLKALGWLGVAVSGTTRATYREYFNRLMREVPAEVLPTVEQTIARYTSDYNHKAKEIVCFRGGDNNHFSCLYAKHMQRRADDLFLSCTGGGQFRGCPI